MIRKITRNELMNLMCTERDLRIVDVLERAHYTLEHISGAISMPLADIEREANRVLRKDDTTVVYCASFECQASTMAANKLMAMGFTNVLDYKGGIKDYKEAGLPLEGSLHKEGTRSFPCPSTAR